MPRSPSIPTAGLERALKVAETACINCSPQVEYLEGLAAVMPEIDETITALRLKLEHLSQLSKVGLTGVASDPDAGRSKVGST